MLYGTSDFMCRQMSFKICNYWQIYNDIITVWLRYICLVFKRRVTLIRGYIADYWGMAPGSAWLVHFDVFRIFYVYENFHNSSPPSAAYMRRRTGLSLVQAMACRLFGAKPLPELMITYCQLDLYR